MFVLRKIVGSGVESNICLNKVYNLILKEINPDDFQKTIELEELKGLDFQKIYGFIIYDEGSKVEPLYIRQQNFIMMSDGKTFSNITYR